MHLAGCSADAIIGSKHPRMMQAISCHHNARPGSCLGSTSPLRVTQQISLPTSSQTIDGAHFNPLEASHCCNPVPRLGEQAWSMGKLTEVLPLVPGPSRWVPRTSSFPQSSPAKSYTAARLGDFKAA
eukprot:1160218-Pelagomonas_calceolata.AAC.22